MTDARRAGMHVIVKEALANGRLTTRNDALAAQKTLAALQVLAREFGNEGPGEFDSFVYKPDAAAIAIAMHQGFDAMVLSGASTTEQMRSNAGAITLLRRFRDGGGEGGGENSGGARRWTRGPGGVLVAALEAGVELT